MGDLGVSTRSAGRDAALAVAWISVNEVEFGNNSDFDAKLKEKVAIMRTAKLRLDKVLLTAKVLTKVTVPLHKKLLHLCHSWLQVVLPHTFSKINRVAFGLLSSEDCKAAIAEDPNVARSRLKLAVPFIGKDVPAKSAEFAHPDVIIGLTILAYRYSGLRYEDFTELVNFMIADFFNEIGPARMRPASQRHEAWVLAAGGTIRGLLDTKSNTSAKGKVNQSLSAVAAGCGEEDGKAQVDETIKEVVQLKFLQENNAEQMQKLFELVKREPLTIHYYLCNFIFPKHTRTQQLRISASGQAVGGNMLVGRRVGFSGTPSDLLPKVCD